MKKQIWIDKKQVATILDLPLGKKARILILIFSMGLITVFFLPLWKIYMTAPQYPRGLSLYIYPHKVEGGNKGQHIQEINTLNHYIGMKPIDRSQLEDLDWIPFAIGALIVLSLRLVVIGTGKGVIDLFVMSMYFTGFVFVRFVYKLYTLGHTLDPAAPMTVEPFTPVIFGTKQIANFTISSYPSFGSIFLLLFVLNLLVILFSMLRKRES